MEPQQHSNTYRHRCAYYKHAGDTIATLADMYVRHIYKIYARLGGKDTAAHLCAVDCNVTPKLGSAYATHRVYISNVHHGVD